MAGRPLSIYERLTKPTISPPYVVEKRHLVIDEESLMSIANDEYGLDEYNENRWREIGMQNRVNNPFTFDVDYHGKMIRIPAIALPDSA